MENKHTVYLNMCHHYRKIFNAKSCVDTSPPKVYQKKFNHSKPRGISPLRAAPNTKNQTPVTKSEGISKKIDNPVICPYFYQHHLKDMERNFAQNSFMVSKKAFSPNILKSEAQSKLRNLHIYHPPRKKRIPITKSTAISQSTNANDQREEKSRSHSVCKSESKPKRTSFSHLENSYSEESSEDSAYNEGECILSSDSRGSTPQITTGKIHSTKRSLGTNTNDRITRKISSVQNEKDGIVYIQFLKEITSDILKKNIFTNKALRTVFHQHMTINKYQLDNDKMQREVNRLQERLGVPLDDQYDDEDFGLGKDTPDAEILDEKEEMVEESASSIESSKETTNDEKASPQNEQIQAEESEDNYSDSFSDLSQSEEKSNTNSDSEEIASDNKELVESSGSDSGKNFRKSASNSDIESDLEISEAS